MAKWAGGGFDTAPVLALSESIRYFSSLVHIHNKTTLLHSSDLLVTISTMLLDSVLRKRQNKNDSKPA